MRKLLLATLVAVVFLTPIGGKSFAQTGFHPEYLVGIWQADKIVSNVAGITFYPDGKVAFGLIEGIESGTYSASEIWLDFTTTTCYIVCTNTQHNYHYTVTTNTLVLSNNSSFHRVRNISASDMNQCPGTPPNRMFDRFLGNVTITDGTPTRLRNSPSKQAEVITSMPEGTVFRVTGGPICADGYSWWQIQMKDSQGGYNGESGWAAEGDFDSYWIEHIPYVESMLPPIGYEDGVTAATPTATPKQTAQLPIAKPTAHATPVPQIADGDIMNQQYEFDDSPPEWSIWQLIAPPVYADEVTCPGGVQTHPGFDQNEERRSQCTAYVTENYPLTLCWLKKPAAAYTWPQQVQERGSAFGFSIVSEPQAGDIVVWDRGCQGADVNYGHVGVVDSVNPDGTINVSERNVDGKGADGQRYNLHIVPCMTLIRPPNTVETAITQPIVPQEPQSNIFQRFWKFVSNFWEGLWR